MLLGLIDKNNISALGNQSNSEGTILTIKQVIYNIDTIKKMRDQYLSILSDS